MRVPTSMVTHLSVRFSFHKEVLRLKGEVHKHHELTEKLRLEKEASQTDFKKHKESVETQVKVGLFFSSIHFVSEHHQGASAR